MLKIATQWCTIFFFWKKHNSTSNYTYVSLVLHSQTLIPEEKDIFKLKKYTNTSCCVGVIIRQVKLLINNLCTVFIYFQIKE